MRKTKHYGKRGPSQIFHYQPTEPTTLLPFLLTALAPKSRSEIKSMLAHNHVAINDVPTKQFDTPLTTKDKVSVNFTRPFAVLRDNQLHIIYEDDYLIVVEKASGLLSVGREHSDEKTAWSILTNYMKQKDARSNAYVCHRLDQYTSGILVFAKSPDIQREMRFHWNDYIQERFYAAVVEGTPDPEENELHTYLIENNKSMMVHVARNPEEGQLAITRYRTMQSSGRYSLLDVEILTGRKNQIRVQLSQIGHPVAGDKKYGSKTSPAGRLMLHNYRLAFTHPVTGKLLRFTLPLPLAFKKITDPRLQQQHKD